MKKGIWLTKLDFYVSHFVVFYNIKVCLFLRFSAVHLSICCHRMMKEDTGSPLCTWDQWGGGVLQMMRGDLGSGFQAVGYRVKVLEWQQRPAYQTLLQWFWQFEEDVIVHVINSQPPAFHQVIKKSRRIRRWMVWWFLTWSYCCFLPWFTINSPWNIFIQTRR